MATYEAIYIYVSNQCHMTKGHVHNNGPAQMARPLRNRYRPVDTDINQSILVSMMNCGKFIYSLQLSSLESTVLKTQVTSWGKTMGSEVEELAQTRQSRRPRIKTSKAIELEKSGRRRGLATANPYATLSQEGLDRTRWDESNESDASSTIEVMPEARNAPRLTHARTGLQTSPPYRRMGASKPTKAAHEKMDMLAMILAAMQDLKDGYAELRASHVGLKASNNELKAQLVETTAQLTDNTAQLMDTETQLAEAKTQLAEAKTQLAEMVLIVGSISGNSSIGPGVSTGGSPPQTYASALTRSINPSSSASQAAPGRTSSMMTDKFYCTVDTSGVEEAQKDKVQPGAIRQAIEKEIRTSDGQASWRCAAVIKDPRNTHRIRVACRDEDELQHVKEAAQKVVVRGVRVLRDQLYPVKVDNANRTAVIDQDGNVLPGAAEVLGKENDVHIAKIAWLSKKDAGKAYGSMVVYVTKGSEATRLLQEQYFHVAGESGYTEVFEPRYGPKQCYKCQELGHKAFSCAKAQVCAKCAQGGHHHSECQATIPKCVPCGGPHESFSKNCLVLYPPIHHE